MLKKKSEIYNIISHHQYKGPLNIRVEKLVIAPDPYYEDLDCDYNELVFYVPSDWLYNWLKNNYYPIANITDMTLWLKEEYTSEDSENIFDDAVCECQIIHYKII